MQVDSFQVNDKSASYCYIEGPQTDDDDDDYADTGS